MRGSQLFNRGGGVLSLLLLASVCGAQTPAGGDPFPLNPVLLTTPPVIDGVLNDAAWSAPPLKLGTWMTYNPLFGDQLKQQTEVWAGYDKQYLYFAFRCLDPEPDKIKSAVSRRDTQFSDDWVGLSLDAMGAHQSSYDMFVNPDGVQGDILNSATGGEATSVDWVWDSAAKRTENGYTVEIRLPLKSIRFRSGAQVRMGVIFWRRISRLGISASWPSLPPGRSLFTRHAPFLLEDVKAPLKLELIPNLTYSWTQERSTPDRWGAGDSKPDAGLTFKYGLTASTTIDGTFRPDFSQVESDAYQVEVNQRYPVFYSEKRPFFMESMGLFELAGSGGDGNMKTAVHTRRIVDPLYGAKLTGTSGKLSYATLSASDQAPRKAESAPAGAGDKLFNVGRAVYSLGNGSYAGGLVVDTEFAGGHNRVAAGDLSLRLGEHHHWSATLIDTQTTSPDGRSSRSGIGAQSTYEYDSKRYGANIQVEHYDANFNMDTAFYNRTGFSGGNVYFGRSFYPSAERWPWFKRFVIFGFAQGARDRVQGGNDVLGLVAVRFHFTRQGYLRLDTASGRESWAGREYSVRFSRIMGDAQLYRWLGIHGQVRFYPRAIYYDPNTPLSGRERGLSFSTTLQPNDQLRQELSYDRDSFSRLGGGARVYAVNLINSKTTYQFDRHFSVRGIVRYDSSQQRVLGDLLGSWEFVPGTVAYLGYGALYENRGWDGENWHPREGQYLTTRRGFFFKVSYLWRL